MRNLLTKFVVASSMLITLANSASAQVAAGSYGSVEGGIACSRNNSFLDLSNAGAKIGDNGCGGTGAIEVGGVGKTVVGVFDYWALRGRLTTFKDSEHAVVGPIFADFKMADRRVVLDAELGAKLPYSFMGGVSRVVVGVRYARWNAAIDITDSFGNSASVNASAAGVGPRIGLRSSIPLGHHFSYESQMGAAALFGRNKLSETDNGVPVYALQANTTVYNLDFSSAISYKFNDHAAGPVASLGVFSEYWFQQVAVNSFGEDFKRNRHSWGPFLRVSVPMQ